VNEGELKPACSRIAGGPPSRTESGV